MDISEEALEALRLYLSGAAATHARMAALARAVLAAWPPPKSTFPSPELLLSPCQVLVQNLIAEARAFHGAVPKESRQGWLQAIEGCKGKIPQSEYDEALAILRA